MTRKLAWTEEAWDDYIYWQGQDKKTLKRINKLISATIREPFEGVGKPEPLEDVSIDLWKRLAPVGSPDHGSKTRQGYKSLFDNCSMVR